MWRGADNYGAKVSNAKQGMLEIARGNGVPHKGMLNGVKRRSCAGRSEEISNKKKKLPKELENS